MTVNWANAIYSLASMAVLWFLASVCWRTYRADTLRHNLFVLRDVLFDVGLERRWVYEHEAYRLLRYRINSAIRFAHKFTTMRLLAMLLFQRQTMTQKREPEDWMVASTTLPEDVRRELNEVHSMIVFTLLAHVMHMPRKVLTWLLKLTFKWRHEEGSEVSQAAEISIKASVEILEASAVRERREAEREVLCPVG